MNKHSAQTFYVSPDGNDAWSGRLEVVDADRSDGPLASLGGARDAIRRLKFDAGGELPGPVTVLVRGGTYTMETPLRLLGGDSGTAACPVTYMAYPDETPRLCGGRPITEWTEHGEGIFKAVLPEVRQQRWWFRQLFCDGRRMIRARWPKFDVENARYGGWAFVEATVSPDFDGSNIGREELDGPWRFQIDPDQVGEVEGWAAADHSDGAWSQATTGQHWNGQGYSGYYGAAWYRRQIVLPEGFDTRAFLWMLFAAADKEATIYLDGKKIFEHTMASTGLEETEIWNQPFKFDVRPWLKAGHTHTLAVRIESNMGNGGLWRPVTLISSDRDVDPADLAGIVAVPMSFRYEADVFPHRWARPEMSEVFIVPGRCWVSDIIPVRAVDPTTRTIHLTRPVVPSRNTLGAATHIEEGNRFYVENNLEDLTEPGEWCLDAEAGEVYFRPPGGDMEAVTVTAPKTIRLLQMIGSVEHPVEHVAFRGFTLTQTQADWPRDDSYYKTPNAGQTVYLENTRHCAIEDCHFDAVGGDAIRLQDDNAHDRITGNHVADAGAYGIFVGGKQPGHCRHDLASSDVPSPTEWFRDRFDRAATVQAWPVSRGHVISNNHIHDVGYFEKHASGIAFYGISAPEVLVSHNLIHHTPRFGIGMMSGFGRITIEYNHLHHNALETADVGAITANRWYTWDEDEELARGMIVRFNRIHDTVGCGAYATKAEPGGGGMAGGRIWAPYYSWGIYFDNAPLNVHVYGNITARNTLGGIMISHYGNDVIIENNIFVDSSRSQGYFLFGGQMSRIVFRRNIFSYAGVAANADYMRINRMTEIDLAAVITEHDHQLYHLPEGADLAFNGLPGEAVERVGMEVAEESGTTFESWRRMGFDSHSVFGDPKFIDPANDDFSLAPDSPALALGFKPIDVGPMGLLPR